jgi:hypothetical protein
LAKVIPHLQLQYAAKILVRRGEQNKKTPTKAKKQHKMSK